MYLFYPSYKYHFHNDVEDASHTGGDFGTGKPGFSENYKKKLADLDAKGFIS